MKMKSLIELNHDISTAFRELTDAQSRLEQELATVEKARESISSNRRKANGAFIEALAHFKMHPHDTSSDIFYGICRLADDAGFQAIAEQLRELSAPKR
jgi:hypothetical protein